MTPAIFDTFEDTEIGIRFSYPYWWDVNKQASEFVWMRAIDPEDTDSRLLLFTLFHDIDTPLADRLEDAVDLYIRQEIIEGITPEVEDLGAFTLADGSRGRPRCPFPFRR